MKKKSDRDTAPLRQGAKLRLTPERSALPYADAQKLIHELEVHQIELELQNEELRKTRLEAETNLERYTELYDFAPVGYITLSRDGIIRQANLTAAKLLGIDRGKLAGQRLGHLVADPSSFNTFLEKVFTSQVKETSEVILSRASPTRRIVRIEATLAESGQVCRAMLTDISEKILMQERLDRFVRFSMDQVAQAAYLIGTDARIQDVNETAIRMLGYSREELLGMPLWKIEPSLQHENWSGHWREIQEQKTMTYESVHHGKRGRPFPVEIDVTFLNFHGQEYNCILARDITRHKMAEQALLDADRRKDEFLALLAHELRNPMAVTSTAAYLLQTKGLTDPEICRWATTTISSQTEQLKRLVDELLDVARIGRGKIALQKTQLDLVQLIAKVEQACRPLMDRRQQHFILSLPSSPLWVEADSARLTQVVTNLLENAVKFTPANGRIELSLQIEQNEAVICIRDTGRGISAELLPRIFDIFTQGEVSLVREEGGLGLGLALVKSLVGLHGGRVTATSEGSGKGAQFTVRLPAVAHPQPAMPSSYPAEAAKARKRRVLIAEDNAVLGEAMAQVLRHAGHSVRLAQDGEAALAAAQAELPEIAIFDIGLPGKDGYTLARSMRNLPDGTRLLLIALTGYGQAKDHTHTRAAGFDYHIVKPADIEQLLGLINAWEPPGKA